MIDERKLKKKYNDPVNPYLLAMTFSLERLYTHLHGKGCEGGKLHVVFEERGDKEDKNLELEIRRVLDEENNKVGVQLPFNIVFSDKQTNATGLQLADLVARLIGRHVLNPEQKTGPTT